MLCTMCVYIFTVVVLHSSWKGFDVYRIPFIYLFLWITHTTWISKTELKYLSNPLVASMKENLIWIILREASLFLKRVRFLSLFIFISLQESSLLRELTRGLYGMPVLSIQAYIMRPKWGSKSLWPLQHIGENLGRCLKIFLKSCYPETNS